MSLRYNKALAVLGSVLFARRHVIVDVLANISAWVGLLCWTS